MLCSVSPGSSFVIETFFTEPDGSAFIANNPATYSIRTPDNALVLSGTAQQDAQIPGRWFATVTLPNSVTIYPQEKKYVLSWSIGNRNNKRNSIEFFNVAPVTDDYTFIENDRVLLEGNTIKDSIILPRKYPVSDLAITILDESGNSYLAGLVNPTPVATFFDKVKYSFSSPSIPTMKAGSQGNKPYIVQWNYNLGTEDKQEYHFIYMISHKMLLAMNDLRRMIDKARNEDIIHQLQFTDVDLVHYLFRALDRINQAPPTFTQYSLGGLPFQFDTCLIYAAAWEALNAQLLAEGVSSFDFSGQSVSLSVDRTAALIRL